MVTPSSPDFHVHDGDTKKFGQLHEDRILGERVEVVVGVRVAQTPEAGPVVYLPGFSMLLQSLLPLVHQLLQEVPKLSTRLKNPKYSKIGKFTYKIFLLNFKEYPLIFDD
jgi:hypothetical protein